MKNWLPYAIVGIFAAWVLGTFLPHHDQAGAFALHQFGGLPVVANGRTQPLDSLARNSLLQLCEKQEVKTQPWLDGSLPWEQKSPKLNAMTWLAEVMFNPALADTRPVFTIDHPDLKGLLAVPLVADAAKESDGRHYSWKQISGKIAEMQEEAKRVGKIEQSKRTTYEQAVSKLFTGMILYMRLENMVEPQDARDWEHELQAFRSNLTPGLAAVEAQKAGQKFDEEALDLTLRDVQRFDTMEKLEPPLAVPPMKLEKARDSWRRMGAALVEIARSETPSPAVDAYARMATAYRLGHVSDFNAAVSEYRSILSGEFAPELNKVGHEQYFNALAPFINAMALYLVAGLCAFVYWFAPGQLEWLRRTAAMLVLLALALHTTGLLFRMILEGRPPVTNLYSSAIFIGWGACLLGLVLERFWRNAIGLVVSCVIGFITLIIAHHLSLSGDTMEMMRAVLDTNIWLATHVVVVTLGYASTFVAGILAVIYVLWDSSTDGLPKEIAQSLGKMVYGIVCFATLFSFVGTVLGGIWADQSWGRFWGWDPKENGALIIVLWNALILHARWGGLVRERGLMLLAIGGNIVTSWSWFGVNMLGIGLHSYGFTDAAFRWLMGFVASQLLLIVLGAVRPYFRGGRGPRTAAA